VGFDSQAAKESALTKLARGEGSSEEQGLLEGDDAAAADDDAETQQGDGGSGSLAKTSSRSGGGSSGGSSGAETAAAFLPKVREQSSAERELAAVYAEEKDVPGWKFGLLWAVFALVIGANLLKGGGGFPSPVGITCGSRGFWLLTAGMFAWIVGVSGYVRQHLSASTQAKKRLGYKYSSGDIAWDERATVVYPLLCVGAGLCAGMFGIGGGIVQVPLMLHLGVHPKVASASSATMIM
jgi:hypothetical protein